MRLELGNIVWISVERGVAPAQVVEIESSRQQLIRLREVNGKIVIRSIHELHATEREALRERVAEEEHWAVHYGALANEATRRADDLCRRLRQMDGGAVSMGARRA
jgi:hypothetical protein